MADGSIHIDTKLDTSGLQSGLSNLGGIAAKGFAAVGAALSGASGFAVKLGSDFEAAMSEVAAISGAVGDDFQLLVDRAKELGAETKFSASDSAEALKYMAMAGWEVQEMYDALPGVMNLAAASGENLGVVSDIVTDAMTAFGMGADQAQYFADVLAVASADANTSVGLMGETFKYVAPVAGSLGYTVDDMAVAIGLLANQGLKAGQAGTYLRSALTHLAAPSEKAATLMDNIGLTIADSTGKIKPLDQLIQDLRTSFAGLTKEQQLQYAATIFGQEAGTAMLALINTSQEDIDELTASVADCKGAAEEMADVMQDNLLGDMEKLGGEAETLGIAVYEHLSQPLRDAAQAGTAMVEQLNAALSDGGLNGLVSAAGDVIAQVVGYIANLVPQVADLAVQLIESFVSGIQSNAQTIALSASAVIVKFTEGVLTILPDLVQTGIDLISELGNGIANAIPFLLPMAADCVARLVEAFISSAPKLLDTGSRLIDSLVSGLTEAAPTLANTADDLINALYQGAIKAIPKLADAAVKIMDGIGGYLEKQLPTIIDSGLKILVGLTGSLRENAGKVVDGAIALAKSLAQGLVDSIPTILQNVPTIVTNIAETINENAPKILKAGIEIIGTLIKGIIDSIPVLIQNLPRIITAIVDTLQAFNWINVGSAIISKLSSGISGAVNIAKNAISSVMNALKGGANDLVSGFVNIGKAIVQGIWTGISSLTSWIRGKISGFTSTIVSAFKNLLGIRSPSRLMRDAVGRNMGLGIVTGLEGTEKDIERTIGDLANKAGHVDLSARMKAIVADRTAEVGSKIGGADEQESANESNIDYEEMAKAIWKHAPDMNTYLDGEEVADKLEPRISEKQAQKAEAAKRRGGK